MTVIALPAHIDRDARYDFTVDTTHGLRLVFFRSDMLQVAGGVRPLWYEHCGDDRTFDAMLRWVQVRRSLWQNWGRLADAIGRDAFASYMSARIDAEPLEEVQGTVFHRHDDPAVLAVGELLSGHRGIRTDILHLHRFASAAARDRFYAWLFTGRNIDRGSELLLLALTEGTAALDAELDRLASPKGGRKSRLERRAGGTTTRPRRAAA